MSAPTFTPTPSDVLPRAILARYVAELFCEPDDAWLARLADPAVAQECRDALTALALPHHLAAAIPPLDDILAERGRLFGHTVRSACPPYELEYGRSEVFQQSQSLADITGFYAAFGFDTAGPLAERPDHVVTQWEFLSLLAHKQSVAPDAPSADCCRDAQTAFLRDHVAQWMPAFFGRIRRTEPDGFFARVADLADALLANWCAALGVRRGPAWLELREVEEEDSTIGCGAEAGAPNVELGPALTAAMDARC